MRNKQKNYHSTNKAVNTVLVSWNPILISDNDILKEEYSSYAPGITKMLFGGTNQGELFNHLKKLRVEVMQIDEDDLKDSQIASELLRIIARQG